MTIKAEIVLDSQSEAGARLTTFLLHYPRLIHSEFMTHRVFSRNASSSRAIPFKKQMRLILEDMVVPMAWTGNQPGMQGGAELSPWRRRLCRWIWRGSGYVAVTAARALAALGLHKQYVNRIVEPWAHITVVMTATELTNFFALRYHYMAMPEINELARQMYWAWRKSTPQKLKAGQWHLPFTDQTEFSEEAIWKSVACCARTSFLNHDKTSPSVSDNRALHERLLSSSPLHASPAEHQAEALGDAKAPSGNFRGWMQYRKTLDHESTTAFEPPDREAS